MAKTNGLYLFEIKPAFENESRHSWVVLAIDNVTTQAQGWLINWEYIDNVLDLLSFVFS